MYKSIAAKKNKIPANTECPWTEVCAAAKTLECRQVGINKLIDFRCPHIASNQVLENLGAHTKAKNKKKFEYRVCCINFKEKQQLEKMLNARGTFGWELVTKEADFYIFKRELIP